MYISALNDLPVNKTIFFTYFNNFSLQEIGIESNGIVTDSWRVNNDINTGDITTAEKIETSEDKIHSASNDSLSTNDEEESGKFVILLYYVQK